MSVSTSALRSELDGELFRGTILVIEDETSVRSALKRLLTSKGIDVIGAATLSDAITLIKRKDLCPDLGLCDYNLPGAMNGVESIHSLRAALALGSSGDRNDRRH